MKAREVVTALARVTGPSTGPRGGSGQALAREPRSRLADVPEEVMARRYALGHAIRVRRKALGLSQEKLAPRAGRDRQSINRVETGAYSPTVDSLWHIAAALGVPPSVLLAEAEAVMASDLAAANGAPAVTR